MVNMLCTWVNIIFNFVYVWNSHNKKLEKLTQNIFMVIYIVTGRFRTKIHISWFQIMFFYYIAKLTILLYPDGCQVALSATERCLPKDTIPQASILFGVHSSLCIYFEPGSVLGAGDSEANKQETGAVLKGFSAYRYNVMNYIVGSMWTWTTGAPNLDGVGARGGPEEMCPRNCPVGWVNVKKRA